MNISRKLLILLALSSISSLGFSAKIDKAFSALKKYDYYTAKELFKKAVKKEPLASYYGQSIIFGRNDNPFYNVDSAYYYISTADSLYSELNSEEKTKILRLEIDSVNIGNWKDSIDVLSYILAEKVNTVDSYDKFIYTNIDAIQINEAISKRNSLAFIKAKEINSARSYSKFIEDYPNSDQLYEAKNRYEERLFIEYTETDDILEYVNFIKQYSNSPYIEAAEDSIFSKTTDTRNQESLYSFIKKYPDNHNVEEAWRKVYSLYIMEYSPQKIIDFKIEYPDYPFLDELVEDIRLAQKLLFIYRDSDYYGFVDKEGKVIIEASYDAIDNFSEGLSLVIKNDSVGYIDKQNELSIPLEYEDGESFINGCAIVSKDDLYGLINRNNEIVVPLQYEYVGNFYSSLAVVSNDTAYGYVNKKGEQFIPLNLEYASDFKDGYAIIEKEGKKGVINNLGSIVIAPKYQWIEPFNDLGLARAKNDSAYGLLNKNGSEVLSFIYDRIGEYSEGLALVSKDGKYGYSNDSGRIAIPLEQDFIDQAMIWGKYINGYVKFYEKEKYGIMDSTGEKIFPAIFEDVGTYKEDQLIAVKKRGKWGYSNTNLRLIIPYKFNFAETFESEYAVIKDSEGYNFINKEGEIVYENYYDEIVKVDTFYIIKMNGLQGLLDLSLNKQLNDSYNSIKPYDEEYFILRSGDLIDYWSIREKKTIIQSK